MLFLRYSLHNTLAALVSSSLKNKGNNRARTQTPAGMPALPGAARPLAKSRGHLLELPVTFHHIRPGCSNPAVVCSAVSLLQRFSQHLVEVSDGLRLLPALVGNGQIETLFDGHGDLDHGERVAAEVLV